MYYAPPFPCAASAPPSAGSLRQPAPPHSRIAWGEYQDYFLGQWDGKKNHLREGQVTQAGDTIWHGHMVPYIVPICIAQLFAMFLQLHHALSLRPVKS